MEIYLYGAIGLVCASLFARYHWIKKSLLNAKRENEKLIGIIERAEKVAAHNAELNAIEKSRLREREQRVQDKVDESAKTDFNDFYDS